MGTVIINGQCYDAVTGLRITDAAATQTKGNDFSDLTPSADHAAMLKEQAKIAAERQAILGSAVSDAKVQPAPKDRASLRQATKRAANNRVPSWISNYVEGGTPVEVQPITEAEREFRRRVRGEGTATGRKLMNSQTLNRRYVRKPSSESTKKVYAAPLALTEDRAKATQAVRHAARTAQHTTSTPQHTQAVRHAAAAAQPLSRAKVMHRMFGSSVAAAATVDDIKHSVKASTAKVVANAATTTPAKLKPATTAVKQVVAAAAKTPVATVRPNHDFVRTTATPRVAKPISHNVRPDISRPAAMPIKSSEKAANRVTTAHRPTASKVSNRIVRDITPRAAKIMQEQPQAKAPTVPSTQATQNTPAKAPKPVVSVAPTTLTMNDDSADHIADVITNALIKEQETNAAAKQAKAGIKRTRSGKRRFRGPAIATAGAAAAILLGYGAYATYPDMQIRIAASKAGVTARTTTALNGYKISGPVAYADGEITVNYRDKSGGTYSVNQRKSNNSDRVVRSEAMSQGSDDLTYEEIKAGNTKVYRYSDKATWLKNGMQYTIDTNDRLTNEQISEIVKSV